MPRSDRRNRPIAAARARRAIPHTRDRLKQRIQEGEALRTLFRAVGSSRGPAAVTPSRLFSHRETHHKAGVGSR